MTLTQLEAFVLVARLGSVKAAAEVLGVSEPAVSGALASLRNHLDDPLIERTPSGMELSPGGKRLVGIASQMVNLAADAEAAIRDAQGAPELVRVVATSTIAEFVAPPVITAFTSRSGSVEASVGAATAVEMPALLSERLADVSLGPLLPALTGRSDPGLSGFRSEPMMRYRLVLVASPHHPLTRRCSTALRDLQHHDWLIGPAGADPSSEIGRLLERLRVPPDRQRVFPSDAAAWTAAADGDGIAPAIAHIVAREVERGALVHLAVEGFPVDRLWYVSTLASDRCPPGAAKLRRFLGTPDAMQAMHRSDGSVPASRFRPPVYVTLWS